MQKGRDKRVMVLKRQLSLGALTPIRESRLRVRFSHVEAVKLQMDLSRAKKVTASRTQDSINHSDEQLVYQAALMARRENARQLKDVSGEHAHARAELLRESLNSEDEAHLGFGRISVPECVKPRPQEYLALEVEGTEGSAPGGDVSLGHECEDPAPTLWSSRSATPSTSCGDPTSPKLWYSRSVSFSSDCEDRASRWSSFSTNSGSVMDRMICFCSALGNACSRQRKPFRWTTRKGGRVVPEFDNVVADVEHADAHSDN
eukprot:TRINITY_DN26807_c1_g4_i1.p1 TRINITY_DN26807_c1_g4~~TRINITY_DN26807_c1_g4_i1.p1  ORF type:complete len:260 (+),score=31.31 TRINITY_DN26807_c1_g4_i1:49-828(+)